MNHASIAAVSALLLLATAAAQRGGPREQPKLANYTIEEGTINSDKVHDGDAGYVIYLPKGYAEEANKDKQYPWVLWLPGFGGPRDFQFRGGAEELDQLRGEGKIPELVLVLYRGPGRRSTYMNGEPQADTEDLLVGDLPAQLQKKYRLATDSKQRALMGCSAGGFGALKIAMRHPDVFGAVAVHSAAILPADPADLEGMGEVTVQRFLSGGIEKELGNPIDKAKWQAQMPLGIVATKKPEDLKGLQIYFDAGTEDNYGFCEPNEQLDKEMTAKGFKHTFVKVEGGGHAWGGPTMKANLAMSMQFIGFALSGKDAVAELAKWSKPRTPGKADDEKGEKKDK